MSFDRPPYSAARGSLNGPTELGQVGRYGGNYYLVTKVGERGGTSGPCVYGPFAREAKFEQLRSRTEWVPDDQVPDEVRVAIATRALMGRVVKP